MFEFLTHNVFFRLLSQTDWLSQFVFLGLVCMSLVCWWVFVFKLHTLRTKLAQVHYVRTRLQSVMTLEELAHVGSLSHNTVVGPLITNSLVLVKKLVNLGPIREAQRRGDRELVAMSLDQTLYDILKKEESFIPMLRISAETGTLIGLFGTVWGLIHAFNRISEFQTADIPTVAPGIAQALIVTLTGLFVAIPALVHSFFVMRKVRVLERELHAIADRLEWIIDTALPYTTKGWELFYETPLSQKTK